MPYTINGKEYSYDSGTNQTIRTMLIEREVYCCLTDEVEYILHMSDSPESCGAPFTDNDIEYETVKICEECGSVDCFDDVDSPDEVEQWVVEEYDEDIEDTAYLCPVCGAYHGSKKEAAECCIPDYRCNSCGALYEKRDYDRLINAPLQITEWWAVSTWFGEKLKAHGAPVIMLHSKALWGRETSGQALAMDHIIARIAYDMGILEGQEYSWK